MPQGVSTLEYLNGTLDKAVKQAARDTIALNVKGDSKSGVKYARIPTGAATCEFCTMLASRGWVYRTEETAGAVEKFHKFCDCQIVPSWDANPHVDGYDPDALYGEYAAARKAVEARTPGFGRMEAEDKERLILAEMRKRRGGGADTASTSGGTRTSPKVGTAAQKLVDKLEKRGVAYREVSSRGYVPDEGDIVDEIAGGDMTAGSCASVALCYAGQKAGFGVLDFRDGESREYFASKKNKIEMFKALGATPLVENSAKTCVTNGKRILQRLEEGKEYYLSVGRHAAIVRSNGGVRQYLELQDPDDNGWKDFGNVSNTLRRRFGCTSSTKLYPTAYATDISQLKGDDFRAMLGYVNTASNEQKKGSGGHVR